MSNAPISILEDRIDALLPQTQCRRCGESGCRPYAAAIARGAAPINRCPPGGDATVAKLAALLDVAAMPLDPSRGEPGGFAIARIDEASCIGCTLCIRACPTDAIVGAAKYVHTVIGERCTGCELCLPPCPVDCIAMLPAGRPWDAKDAARARQNVAVRQARASAAGTVGDDRTGAREVRKAALAAAFERARARRARAARP